MPPKPDILAVKQRHEVVLMSTPGVEGVAVGEEAGAPAIVIYVSDPSLRRGHGLPADIEGIAVKVKATGSFDAQE